MADTPNNDTQRYMPDSIFKRIMDLRFTQLGIPLQTQVEVSHLPRTIDAVVVLRHETDQEKVRLETPFPYAGPHNLIEFKGENDRLTIPDFRLILGRSNLYMGENRIPVSDITITIVCAGTPRKVLKHSQAEVEFESLGGGYYRSTDKLPVHIIAINELEVTPKNYPLLMFATSKQKFEEFLRDAVDRNDSDHNSIITFAYFLRSELIREIDMPLKNRLSKEALDIIIEDIGDEILSRFSVDEILSRFGVDEIASRLSPEERLTGLSPEEIVSRLSPEERLTGLSPEEIVSRLSPEERRQLQRLLE